MRKKVFADNIWGEIYTSQIEQYFIGTSIFNRLHYVHQTSMLYFVYPTMTLSRFEHSLGTMYVAGRIFEESIANAEQDTVDSFLKNYRKIFESWMKDEDIYNRFCGGDLSKLSDYFNEKYEVTNNMSIKGYTQAKALLSNNIVLRVRENLKVFAILLQAVRLAGLLHDLGHPPYSHVVENAINSIQKIIDENEIATYRAQKFSEIYNSYSNKQLHESIGDKLITKLFSKYKLTFKDSMEYVYGQLVITAVQKILSGDQDFEILHQIVSGMLDADRIDYMLRCANASGLKSKINPNRLINSYKLLCQDMKYFWGIDSKNIHDVQIFLLDYKEHYDYLIGHHAYVKIDKILQNVILNMAIEYIKQESCDGDNSDVLPLNISGLWYSIEKSIDLSKTEKKMVQWDDNWLMVVLKEYYFNTAFAEDGIFKKQIEEILSNEKNYHSLIKRRHDYKIVDELIVDKLVNDSDFLELCYKNILINELLKSQGSSDTAPITKRNINKQELTQFLQNNKLHLKKTDIIFNAIRKLKGSDKECYQKLSENNLVKIFKNISLFERHFEERDKILFYVLNLCVPDLNIEEKFNSVTSNVIKALDDKGIEVSDIFIVKNGKNLNLKDLYNGYKTYDYIGNLRGFDEYSLINDLNLNVDRNQYFYCYYLPKSDKKITTNVIFECLAEEMAKIIIERLKFINI